MIHGGNTFDTYADYLQFLREYVIDFERVQGRHLRWQDTLGEKLGEEYEVVRPAMPSKYNAKYVEWKIWFEKHLSYVHDDVILVGTSLGGIFLAKYLSENAFPVRIKATYLVAAPHDAEGLLPRTLTDFVLPESLDLFAHQSGEVYLIHSTDDPVVKFEDAERYAIRLPKAHKIIFKDRGHFSQEEFPELVEKIKRATVQDG